MVEPLYELLAPYLDTADPSFAAPSLTDSVTNSYLARLTSLPLAALSTTEPQSLSQSSQSALRSLQGLSKRSHKAIISASDRLNELQDLIPQLDDGATEVQEELPALDDEASTFADKYSKMTENAVLDRRKKILQLAQNVDRVADVLDLPTLLSSAVTSSTGAQAASSASVTPVSSNYASALDIHAHIKRLNSFYPELNVIRSISAQAEEEMRTMTTNLISSLQIQNVKMAGAMKTIGWLRRVAPELDDSWSTQRDGHAGNSEGTLGAVFLTCRLASLLSMLDALAPLRDLADQETAKRLDASSRPPDLSSAWSGGQQTERFLKRYLEIFREQSFAIISMYKSIFPATLPVPDASSKPDTLESSKPASLTGENSKQTDSLTSEQQPSALATFPLHLVELLFETLRNYLPNVQDRASRESLFTQILYCSGSLGRLGGDFGIMLAELEEHRGESLIKQEPQVPEWVAAMKKHKIQASRLELLASGVGVTRK